MDTIKYWVNYHFFSYVFQRLLRRLRVELLHAQNYCCVCDYEDLQLFLQLLKNNVCFKVEFRMITSLNLFPKFLFLQAAAVTVCRCCGDVCIFLASFLFFRSR
jgi:hypothetical protein